MTWFTARFHPADKSIDRNILKGIIDSHRFLNIASEIPCDIIQALETDADQAELFVQQIQAGEVPTIIKDLPQEVVDAFQSLVDVALKLPAALLSDAESAVGEAVHVFDDIEDGQIVSDIEQLPGEVETAVTSLWGDVTSDIVGGWNDLTHGVACFFEGGCASATTGACMSSTAATTPASAVASQTMPYYTLANSTAASAYHVALSSAAVLVSQIASQAAQTTQSSLYPTPLTTQTSPSSSTTAAPSASEYPSSSHRDGRPITEFVGGALSLFVGLILVGMLAC